MRFRKITFTAQTSFALGFGLAAASLFWWETSEPILSSSWSGSTEQWLAWRLVSAQRLWHSAARSLPFPRQRGGTIKRSASNRVISPLADRSLVAPWAF
jgi:hypothetical protein